MKEWMAVEEQVSIIVDETLEDSRLLGKRKHQVIVHNIFESKVLEDDIFRLFLSTLYVAVGELGAEAVARTRKSPGTRPIKRAKLSREEFHRLIENAMSVFPFTVKCREEERNRLNVLLNRPEVYCFMFALVDKILKTAKRGV